MIRFLRRLRRSESGIAMTEFALVLPALMLMFYGCIEITRFILITQKVEKLAHTTADVVAQSRTLTSTSMEQVMAAVGDIMDPFATGANSAILVQSLYRAVGDANAKVNWCYKGGGSLGATSQIGAVNDVPVMPSAFTFNERENVISAEVFYQFSPLISSHFFGTTTIYRVAFYKPRFGLLTTAPTGGGGAC